MTPDDDPGWPPGLFILIGLIPGGIQWYLRRRGKSDGLIMLRQVFLSFSLALVSFGVVLAFLKMPDTAVLPWLPLLMVLAIASLVVARVAEKPLDCAALSGSYRTRFFLRLALAESVALFGFVFAFIGGGKWIYYAGAAFTLARFWTYVAPTRAALTRDQHQLNASGCGQSLIAALREPSAPNPRSRCTAAHGTVSTACRY
jgi:F0F1-type ATP synthase membrane subunit c/vacuolar-type H+-ATPase subunit K